MIQYHLHQLKQRCLLLLLLEAGERAGITPLSSSKLHAFAYLADVLSPVWNLVPVEGKIYKTADGPHYADLQDELDYLVVAGLVHVRGLHYAARGLNGARIAGSYTLNLRSEPVIRILDELGVGDGVGRGTSDDRRFHQYLVEVAGAFAMLGDREIQTAASADVTYRTGAVAHDIVDFAEWAEDKWEANPSWRVAERFRAFLPANCTISPSEKVYLYARYLRRTMDAH